MTAKRAMTASRLDEIEERVAAVEDDAPTPWGYADLDGDVYDATGMSVLIEMSAEVAVLVANAPADLADLLAEVKRLRANADGAK